MEYLGYVVDRNGLHVDLDKVKAMPKIPVLTTVSEVKRIVPTIVTAIRALLRKEHKFFIIYNNNKGMFSHGTTLELSRLQWAVCFANSCLLLWFRGGIPST